MSQGRGFHALQVQGVVRWPLCPGDFQRVTAVRIIPVNPELALLGGGWTTSDELWQ